MVSINSNANLNPDWFVRKGPYAVVKDEYKEQVRESLTQAKAQAQKNLQTNFNKPDAAKGDCGLTEQQKTELAGKYNPNNMSIDEYNNFVDDLCSYGIISGEAKGYVASSILTPLEYAESGLQISASADAPAGVSYSLQNSQNNVLDWVRYRASFEEFDPVSESFQKSPVALLFGKIEQVLNQLLD